MKRIELATPHLEELYKRSRNQVFPRRPLSEPRWLWNGGSSSLRKDPVAHHLVYLGGLY